MRTISKLATRGLVRFAARAAGSGLVFVISAAAASADTVTYRDMCEASAAVAIDADSFAVASDESNKLRIYHRGNPNALKQVKVTSFDKSDIEGAATLDGTTFWISSQSLNKQHEDKPKRKVLFATVSDGTAAAPSLAPKGNVFGGLRDPLLAAIQQLYPNATVGDINVEGLAAAPESSLMIGLRAPGANGKDDGPAIVVRLRNPFALIGDNPPAPEFDAPLPVDLGGRGVRNLEQIGSESNPYYLIVAGPRPDDGDFALYGWDGKSATADLKPMDFEGIKPEAMFATGNGTLQFLGDNGSDDCDEEDGSPASWWFPSIERPLP